MQANKYFLLFSNCILTKGFSRSIIADLQSGFYITITTEHSELLNKLKKHSIKKVLENSDNARLEIKSFVDYLIELNLGHYCSSNKEFPPINKEFKLPYRIIDCIIELSDFTYKYHKSILKSLTNLGCQTIELRAYHEFSLKIIQSFLNEMPNTRVRNVEIYLPFSEKIGIDNYNKFVMENPIVGKMVIHSCANNFHIKNNSEFLLFTKQIIHSASCCGNISQDIFSPNLPSYLLSLNANSCLHKKVSIDKNGDIKNCPSMKQSFGNIKINNIEEALNKNEFKKYGSIKKDDIAICKDCEFRHICTDCRAYVENPEDLLSKPLKCGYNPYTNVWEDWSTNPLKQNAINHYGLI